MQESQIIMDDTTGFFVINLDRSPERWDSIQKQLSSIHVNPHRVAAIDGRGREVSEFPECNPKQFRLSHGNLPLPTEIACSLSHIKTLREFLASGYSTAVVLEDDAILADDFADAVAAALRHSDQWDLLLLYGNHSGFPAHLVDMTEKYSLCGLSFRQTGSVAYMINRPCAERLVASLVPIRVPIDHAFTHPSYHKLKMRACLPYPVPATAKGKSTIGGQNVKRERPQHWRLLSLVYRTKQEILRLAHYMFVDPIFFRALGDAMWRGKK